MPRTIFDNIVIHHYEEATSFQFCEYTPIRFFEILFIRKGEGTLVINNHRFPYKGNQLFILIPYDQYTFEIETPTTTSAVKFIKSLFINSDFEEEQGQRKEWFKKIESILHSSNRTSNVNIRTEADKSSIESLLTVICNEYNDSSLKSETILKATLHCILHILSRNTNSSEVQYTSSKIQEIINYIHNNIYHASKLSKHAIAEKFNLSENYVSEYFKKQMGVTLKKYILNHKLSLVETRLQYSDLTFSEIALELGFTDSSHLDKTFVSYKGITPSYYRSQHQIK